MKFTQFFRREVVIRTSALLSAALMLASCNAAKPTLACFPEDAQKWIYCDGEESCATNNEADDLRRSQVVSAEKAVFYFDRSASMVGYLNGADNDNRPLHILIDNLPGIAKRAGADHAYVPFGTDIGEPMADAREAMLQPAFYRDCVNGVGQSCDSNLRELFEKISKSKDELAVVVTDLWYEEGGAEKQGAAPLQAALTDILADGRAIALYGIDAPFRGKIYDIPQGGDATTSVAHVGTHPLFVMVVGSKGDVVEFDRQMEATVGMLQRGLESGEINRSIFTIDPGPLRPVRKAPVEAGNDQRLELRPFETYPGLAVQQFWMDVSSGARKSDQENIRSAYWEAPKEDDFLPHTIHEGPMKANVSVWRRSDPDDQCSRWRSVGNFVEDAAVAEPPKVEGETAGAQPANFKFDMRHDALAKRIRRPGVYLVSGQLERVSINRDNGGNMWAQPWSFSASSASRFARGRPAGSQFPTLNLNQFLNIMENALQTATERKGGGVVGFAVLVNAEN